QPVPEHELSSELWTVAFSPDGTWLAAGGINGLRVWRIPGRGAGWPPPGPPLPLAKVANGEFITALCFSPDNKRLAWLSRALGEAGYRIALCDLPEGQVQHLRARPRHFILPLAFTPDNRHLTFVSSEGLLEVWDV